MGHTQREQEQESLFVFRPLASFIKNSRETKMERERERGGERKVEGGGGGGKEGKRERGGERTNEYFLFTRVVE